MASRKSSNNSNINNNNVQISDKEFTMNANFALINTDGVELDLTKIAEYANDDSFRERELDEQVAFIMEGHLLDEADLFITKMHESSEVFNGRNLKTYESQRILGAFANLMRFKRYSGLVEIAGHVFQSNPGMHFYSSPASGFESVLGIAKWDSPLGKLLRTPEPPAWANKWMNVRQRNGDIRLVTNTVTNQQVSHDFVDLLMTQNVRVWVAPIRRYLAAMLLQLLDLNDDRAGRQQQTEWKRSEVTRNFVKEANRRDEVEVSGAPKAETVNTAPVVTVIRIKGTSRKLDLSELEVGKRYGIWYNDNMKMLSLVYNPQTAVRFQTAASEGYLLTE